MKRHEAVDAELPLRNKRILMGDNSDHSAPPPTVTMKTAKKQKAGFFDLAQELRDAIYDLTLQDIPHAHRGRRDAEDLASNSWEIGYVNAPTLPPLLLSPEVSEDYLSRVASRMYVVVHVSMSEENILDGAPWHTSLPEWVRENLRGVRVILSFGSDGLWFAVEDLYACVQNTLDCPASSLPNLYLIDVLIWYATMHPFDTLLEDVEDHGLDLVKLLNTQPTTAHIEHSHVSILMDVSLCGTPRPYSPYGEMLRDRLGEGKGLGLLDHLDAEQQHGRWNATLSDLPRQYTFMGLKWHFIAPVTAEDEDEDVAVLKELRTPDDGSSDNSSVTDISGDTMALDSEDLDIVKAEQESRSKLYSDLDIVEVHRKIDTLIGYDAHTARWIGGYGEERVNYEPSLSDWNAVLEAGVNMDRALCVLGRYGRRKAALQQFKAMGGWTPRPAKGDEGGNAVYWKNPGTCRGLRLMTEMGLQRRYLAVSHLRVLPGKDRRPSTDDAADRSYMSPEQLRQEHDGHGSDGKDEHGGDGDGDGGDMEVDKDASGDDDLTES